MSVPIVEISKRFRFDAAHWLPAVPPGHKDRGLHGHTYRVVVRLRGPVATGSGFVRDFSEVSAAVKPVLAALDHRCLNDVSGLENPTSELIACWLWERLQARITGLTAIEVMESEGSSCTFRGEGLDDTALVAAHAVEAT